VIKAAFKKAAFPLGLLIILLLLLESVRANNFIAKQGWGLLAAEIMVVVLLFFFWSYERGTASSREAALVAALGAVGAVARIPFAAIPNLQPTTFIVLASGFVFGPRAGFMVGATAALTANFFLGQGPWTPWQMFSWGLAGASSGLLGKIFPRAGVRGLALFGFFWGYFYGWIMNLWFWTAFIHPLTWRSFIATYAASFWFDTFHAAGNVAFAFLFGESFLRILKRFCCKLTVWPLLSGAGKKSRGEFKSA
jgi:energy-coupling factor transport system substrate-specific component